MFIIKAAGSLRSHHVLHTLCVVAAAAAAAYINFICSLDDEPERIRGLTPKRNKTNGTIVLIHRKRNMLTMVQKLPMHSGKIILTYSKPNIFAERNPLLRIIHRTNLDFNLFFFSLRFIEIQMKWARFVEMAHRTLHTDTTVQKEGFNLFQSTNGKTPTVQTE